MNYRFDGRSKEQFEKDILDRTLEEKRLFLLWIQLLEKKNGQKVEYKNTGCDNSGEYLEDQDVSTVADFEVEGYGRVEVKFSKPVLDKFFHLKSSQVKKYINQNATILMVNGTSSDKPVYTMLDAKCLTKISEECKEIPWAGFGRKMSYKIPINMFIWRPLT